MLIRIANQWVKVDEVVRIWRSYFSIFITFRNGSDYLLDVERTEEEANKKLEEYANAINSYLFSQSFGNAEDVNK